MTVSPLRPQGTCYRLNGRECVCQRWDPGWERSQGHHVGCRRLLSNKVEGMTPAEAHEKFGPPPGELDPARG